MPRGKGIVPLCTNKAVSVNPEEEYIDNFESVNSLTSTGVPLHELKVSVVIMFLKNFKT